MNKKENIKQLHKGCMYYHDLCKYCNTTKRYVSNTKCVKCEYDKGVSNRGKRPEYHMWANAKARAKRKNIPFNIEVEDIEIPEFCPVFNIKMEIGTREEFMTSHAPSLDKLIPALGYVKGNIKVISMRANIIKSFSSINDIERIIQYMEAHGL